MASSQRLLLLALCATASVAGDLLPGEAHQHGTAAQNSIGAQRGHQQHVPPAALKSRPPPGRLPKLYFPPPIPSGAQIAIEPTDEVSLTPLFPGEGQGASSVPDFVQPTFGGWIPMTSSEQQFQSSLSTGQASFGSPPASHSQLAVGGGDAEWAQGTGSTGQQFQPGLQTGGGAVGPFTSVSVTSGGVLSQGPAAELSQIHTTRPGGEEEDGELLASYVPPSSEGNGLFSQEGSSVATLLKPLDIPQTGDFLPQSGNSAAFSSSVSTSGGAPFSPGEDSPPIVPNPLNQQQTVGVPSQFTPGTGDSISNTLPAFGHSTPGDSIEPSQEASLTEGAPQSLPQPAGGDIPLPPSYVPPSQEGASSPFQGNPVPTQLRPLDLPQTEELSQSQFQASGDNSDPPSFPVTKPLPVGGNSLQEEDSVPANLKPLNLPQIGHLPPPSPSEVGSGGVGSPSLLYAPPSSGGGSTISQEGPVQFSTVGGNALPQNSISTDLRPLNLPHGGESSSQFTSQPDSAEISGAPLFTSTSSGSGDTFHQGDISVPTILKPINLPQTEGIIQSSSQSSNANSATSVSLTAQSSPGDDNSILQEGSVSTNLRPLNLPQISEQTSPFTSQTGGVDINGPPPLYVPPSSGGDIPPSHEEGLVPTNLKPIDLPQTEGSSQSSSQSVGEGVVSSFPSEYGPSSGSGSSFSQGGSIPTFLKPLGLPNTGGASSQLSSQTLGESTGSLSTSSVLSSSEGGISASQGQQFNPTILKPLNLPQAGGTVSQISPQAGDRGTSLPSSSIVLPSSGSGETLLQGGDLPLSVSGPFNTAQSSGVSHQSSSQTDSEGSDSLAASFESVSSGFGSPFQGDVPVSTILKPIDLPPQIGESQPPVQTNGGGTGGSGYSYPSSGVIPSIQEGITSTSPSFVSQQEGNEAMELSSNSHIQSGSGAGSSSQGLGSRPSSVPTQLKPLGLPTTEGFSTQSSPQLSSGNIGSQFSSFVPATLASGVASQVGSSNVVSSPPSAAQQTGSGGAPPPWSYRPPPNSGGGVPTPQLVGAPAPPQGEIPDSSVSNGELATLKPLNLPQQSVYEPDQFSTQTNLQSTGTGNFGLSGPSSTSENVDNLSQYGSETPVEVINKPLFAPVSQQGGTTRSFGSTSSLSSPDTVDNYTPGGPTRPAVETAGIASSAGGGGSTLPANQAAEPVYQPEEILGVAASGGVGSSVPFPSGPVQTKPLGLPQQPSSAGQIGAEGLTDAGSPVRPPTIVVDEQFITSPSGGAAIGTAGAPEVSSGTSGFVTGSSGGGDGGVSSGGTSGGVSGGSGGGSGSFGGSGGGDSTQAEVVSQKFTIDKDGNYMYSYEQSDGQAAQEVGRVTPGNEPETGTLVSTGGYRYSGDDGRQYAVEYTADERGFLPIGDHLPTPPAQIPAYAELRQKYPALFWAERLRVGSPQQ